MSNTKSNQSLMLMPPNNIWATTNERSLAENIRSIAKQTKTLGRAISKIGNFAISWAHKSFIRSLEIEKSIANLKMDNPAFRMRVVSYI